METDVLIVGAGPCGITLANLLGVYGLDATIIDRSTEVIDYPRGVGVDDESLRVFQATGLGETVHKDMIQNQALIWFDSQFNKLAEIAPSGQPFGWPRRNSFLQPMLETKLRAGLDRFDQIELLTGHELVDLAQDHDAVTAEIRDAEGNTEIVRAQYVVGADGGRSTVRGLIGATLEGTSLPARWLVVDIKNSTYHAPFSGNYISSERPFVSIDLPFGYRRFEFRLNADETPEEMSKPEAVERLIRTHFDWEGPMPGIERARIYTHHSRVANKFKVGRVFLAGDAAHLQPPWFGQGMNSGIRDAANLAWKLAAVVGHGAHPQLLDTYEQERRGHAKALVELATTLGKVYGPRNKLGEKIRSYGFRAMRRIPVTRDYLLQMKFKPMPYYKDGVVLDPDPKGPVGRMFIQPDVELPDGSRVKFDIAAGDWFTVVGINVDPVSALDEKSLAYWRSLGARFLRINRSRAGEHMLEASTETVVVDDVQAGFRDWSAGKKDRQIVIIRPDRYLAATCSVDEASSLTARFSRALPLSPQTSTTSTEMAR